MVNQPKDSDVDAVELEELPERVERGVVTQTISVVHHGKRVGTFTPDAAEQHARAKVIRRNQAVIRLLDEWMADESGYDEDNWPPIERALDANRRLTGERPLIGDDEDHP